MLAFTILCACLPRHQVLRVLAQVPRRGSCPASGSATVELAKYPGANLYFTVYFLTTGLHAFHVIVGMSVLLWVAKGVSKGRYTPEYYVPVELGALYWHLVDLVWIFLFPLLYLI